MGSPKDEKGRFDDEEQHEVELAKGFYLGKYEVTQEDYQAIMGKNPSAFKGPKFPVANVTWKDAKDFCQALSLKEGKGGKDGKGDGGYRLPSEAEWEWACRAGATTAYHFGDTVALDQANLNNPKKNEPRPVGGFAPNSWGLYDMHGNVWEWCEESYTADYAKNKPRQDPKGPLKATTSRRVVRGRGWGSDPRYGRSAARFSHEGTFHPNVGFRVALTAAESGKMQPIIGRRLSAIRARRD